jgi:hypothetical protein
MNSAGDSAVSPGSVVSLAVNRTPLSIARIFRLCFVVIADSDHPTTSIIKSDFAGRTRYTRQYKREVLAAFESKRSTEHLSHHWHSSVSVVPSNVANDLHASLGSVVSDRIKSYFQLFLRLIFGRDFPGQAAWAF